MPGRKEEIRVLLIHEHEIAREGIKTLIAKNFPRAVFSELTSIHQSLEMLESHTFDLVLSDIEAYGFKGFEIIRQCAQLHEALPIIVYAAGSDDVTRVEAIRNGAWAYVENSASCQELIQAVRTVLSGSRYVNESLSRALRDYIRFGLNRALPDRLSNRELEVLENLRKGKSVAELADLLKLHEKTIRTYKRRLLSKFNVQRLEDLENLPK